jgi:hypothetical protein
VQYHVSGSSSQPSPAMICWKFNAFTMTIA